MTRAYLIEPQSIFVEYLEGLLASAGLEVVASSREVDGRDIIAHDPAAVFVDVDFFERGGPNALCRIRQATRSAAVIAYSQSTDPTYAAACFISGADAVISKDAAEDRVLSGLREAVAPADRRRTRPTDN